MDKTFDKFLTSHINVELKLSGMDTFTTLNEEHGHVDFIEDYIYAIDSELETADDKLAAFDSSAMEYLHMGIEVPLKIDIYKKLPHLQKRLDDYNNGKIETQIPFFRTIYLNLVVYRYPYIKSTGGYNAVQSDYYGNGEGDVWIELNISAPTIQDVFGYINSNLEHELLHALEDYVRRTGSGESLYDHTDKVGYYNYLHQPQIMDVYEQSASNLLYSLNDSEINASVAEIYAELMSNKEIILGKCDNHSILELIRSTDVYSKIMRCRTWLKTLSELDDPKLVVDGKNKYKDDLLDYVNEKIKNVDIRIKREYYIRTTIRGEEPDDETSVHFERYSQMMRYFRRQLQKFERRIMDRAPKMACDIFLIYGKYAHHEKKYLAGKFDYFRNKYGRKVI